MATLIAGASGSLNAAATWRTIDAIAGSQNFTGTAAISLTTTPGTGTDSPTWTGDSSTVNGILVQLAAIGGSVGTLTLTIRQTNGTPADIASVNIDIAELPASGNGWILATFSPVTLVSGNTYTLRAYRSSGASTLSLMATSSTTNWNRCLRTSSAPGAAPAAADILHIAGEFTGAGAPTARTVTIDSNLTTAYGNIAVSNGGTLAYAYGAGTTYTLRIAGNLYVYGGGTLTIGTVANPIPATTTAILEFAVAADGGYGLIVTGTLTAQGASKTYDRCLLAANAAIGATALTTDISTGWAIGDQIAIAATDLPASTTGKSEARTLSNVSGTTLTVPAITNAHDGTAPTQARIINLTRNVKIRSTSSTLMTYVQIGRWATIDLDWIEAYYLGENTAGKRGIEVDTRDEGNFSMNRCSVHDCEDFGLYLGSSSTSNNISCTNNVTYNLASVAGPGITTATTSGTNYAIDGNVFMQVIGSSSCDNFKPYEAAGSISNNEIIGGYKGFYICAPAIAPGALVGNKVSSCRDSGLVFYASLRNATFEDLEIRRCYGGGIVINAMVYCIDFIDPIITGNRTYNIAAFGAAGLSSSRIRFLGAVLAGDATSPSSYGLALNGANFIEKWEFIGCDFGTPAGSGGNARVAHSSADVYCGNSDAQKPAVDITIIDTILASSVEVLGNGYMAKGSTIRSQRTDGTPGSHRSWLRTGQIAPDATVYKTEAPSTKLSPGKATEKLESEGRIAPVKAGTFRTVSVWVRKDASYAGAAPRLIVRRNDGAGSAFAADAVLDSLSVGADSWEQLTGTTGLADDDTALEFFVDCDGTAGAVYIDDWAVV